MLRTSRPLELSLHEQTCLIQTWDTGRLCISAGQRDCAVCSQHNRARHIKQVTANVVGPGHHNMCLQQIAFNTSSTPLIQKSWCNSDPCSLHSSHNNSNMWRLDSVARVAREAVANHPKLLHVFAKAVMLQYTPDCYATVTHMMLHSKWEQCCSAPHAQLSRTKTKVPFCALPTSIVSSKNDSK